MNYENYRGKTLTIRDLSAGASNYVNDSLENDTDRDFLFALFKTIQNNAIEILNMFDELETIEWTQKRDRIVSSTEEIA